MRIVSADARFHHHLTFLGFVFFKSVVVCCSFFFPLFLLSLVLFSIVLWLRKSKLHLRYVHLQRFVHREMLCHIIKTFSILFSIVQCRGAEKLFFTYELSAGVASEFSFPIRQQKFISVEVVSIFLDVPAGGTQRSVHVP